MEEVKRGATPLELAPTKKGERSPSERGKNGLGALKKKANKKIAIHGLNNFHGRGKVNHIISLILAGKRIFDILPKN